MNERLKKLRKTLKLTMKQFAEPLGLTESTISKAEKGTANLSDSAVRLICSVFKVDYFWLTEGKGEMFTDSTDALLDEIAAENHMSGDTVDTFKRLFKLPPDKFDLVLQLIKSLSDAPK